MSNLPYYIRDVPLGTEINYQGVDTTIVGRHINGNLLIGWTRKNNYFGWAIEVYSYLMTDKQLEKVPDFNSYAWFHWVVGSETCLVIQKQMISPNQVCIGCNLPAPHVKPNVDDKFVCAPCKFLRELDGGSGGG